MTRYLISIELARENGLGICLIHLFFRIFWGNNVLQLHFYDSNFFSSLYLLLGKILAQFINKISVSCIECIYWLCIWLYIWNFPMY